MIVSSIYGDPYVVINWLIWTRVGTRLIRETLAATLASVKNVSEHNARDPIYGDNPWSHLLHPDRGIDGTRGTADVTSQQPSICPYKGIGSMRCHADVTSQIRCVTHARTDARTDI